MASLLQVQNVHASVEDTAILKGVDIQIGAGEIHVIMGPNGSGKSTISNVIMGNPEYQVTKGTIAFNGNDITEAEPHERAQAGIFMAFQYPREIAGVNFAEFLKASYSSIQTVHDENFKIPNMLEFKKKLKPLLKDLQMKSDFLNRYVNEGFSGGEKKKAEMLQLMLLSPKLAILDETDSGLDVDALKIVGETVGIIKKNNPKTSLLLVTHYQRILEYIVPDVVHVMIEGRIVETGDASLARKLEETGYKHYKSKTSTGGLTMSN